MTGHVTDMERNDWLTRQNKTFFVFQHRGIYCSQFKWLLETQSGPEIQAAVVIMSRFMILRPQNVQKDSTAEARRSRLFFL